jgi:hypothetical protein
VAEVPIGVLRRKPAGPSLSLTSHTGTRAYVG